MRQLSHPNFQLQICKKINVDFFFSSWKPTLKDFIFTLKTPTIMLEEEKSKRVVIIVARDEFLEKRILNQTQRISDAQPRAMV